jgi:hypothetical protein
VARRPRLPDGSGGRSPRPGSKFSGSVGGGPALAAYGAPVSIRILLIRRLTERRTAVTAQRVAAPRPLYEAEDFGSELTPELKAQEERLRAELERRKA